MRSDQTRMKLRLSLFAALFGLLFAMPAFAATSFEPGIHWMTLESKHFRVDFPANLESIGRRVLAYAEDAHKKVAPFLKTDTYEKTEIVCFDTYDDTNANATTFPHNIIHLNLHPPSPDDGLPIGRYDDWIRYVILHEYTHIMHFDETPWAISELNAMLGGLLFSSMPIAGVPMYVTDYIPHALSDPSRFIAEGLAVNSESKFTPGGRVKEGDFGMELRMAALDHKLYSLDQVYGIYLLNWPAGGAVYDYGTDFIRYLRKTYGDDALRKILHLSGKMPWLGMDYAIGQVLPGQTTVSIFDDMIKWLVKRSKTEVQEIESQPLTVSERLTTTGRYHEHPHWQNNDVLTFTESTKGIGTSLVRLDLAGDRKTKPLFSKDPLSDYAYSPDGRSIYYSIENTKQFTSYDDLYRYDLQTHASTRLTHGARAVDPAPSPDGKTLLAVTTADGYNGLTLFDTNGKFLRTVIKPTPEQTFANPYWMPNSRKVLVSRWTPGHYHIVEVDVDTGKQTALTKGSALDYYPSLSPDGKYVIFTSDRSGVSNLYALRLSDRKLFQLTNVVGGAFEGVVSPDGKQIAFVNYSSVGYDIHVMPFHPESGREVSMDDILSSDFEGHYRPRPVQQPTPVDMRYALSATPHPYNPWPFITPNSYMPLVFRDMSGLDLAMSAYGQDALNQHYFNVVAGYGLGSGRPLYSLYYQNDQLLPSIAVLFQRFPSASNYQTLTPDSSHIQVQTLLQDQQTFDLSARVPGIPWPLLGGNWITGDSVQFGFHSFNNDNYALNTQDFSVSGTSATQTSDTTTPVSDQSKLQKSPLTPDPGLSDSLYVMWQRANDYRQGYGISPEGGSLSTLGYQKGSPAFGGTGAFDRVWGDYRQYFSLPWKYQVLAVRAVTGLNWGQNGGQFTLGGNYSPYFFNRTDLTETSSLFDSTLPFPGYDTAGIGNKFADFSAEYRFPLMTVEHGIGIWPVFVNNVYGVVGYNVGNVWDSPLFKDQYRPFQPDWTLQGLSLELRFRLNLLREFPTDLRLGVARGLTTPPSEWPQQDYAVPATQLILGFGSTF